MRVIVASTLFCCSCTSTTNGGEPGDCELSEQAVSGDHPAPFPVDEAEGAVPGQAVLDVLWTPTPHDDTTPGPPRRVTTTLEWTRLATLATVAERGYEIYSFDDETGSVVMEPCVEGTYLRLGYQLGIHVADGGFVASGDVVVQVDAAGHQTLLTVEALDDSVALDQAWVDDSPGQPGIDASSYRIALEGRPDAPTFHVEGIYPLDEDGTESVRSLWTGVSKSGE